MPYHTTKSNKSNSGSDSSKKKMTKSEMNKLSDSEYYKEHSKHHTPKHIKAMKELQKLGVDRNKSHSFVQKYMGS
tara:strand:+ start:4361 stop:4585 length:225 start_codon:yes stop_codon:yes gene_type:complete